MNHILLSLVACAIAATSQAVAQTKIEEIVVTAKNRTERLQDVPLSISAFSADVLRANQIVDVRDLQRITPALNAYSFTGRSDPNGLSLRGVAPNTSDERYQGVSFFLDGIALSGQLTSLDLAGLEGPAERDLRAGDLFRRHQLYQQGTLRRRRPRRLQSARRLFEESPRPRHVRRRRRFLSRRPGQILDVGAGIRA
jgi:hypothetical protein